MRRANASILKARRAYEYHNNRLYHILDSYKYVEWVGFHGFPFRASKGPNIYTHLCTKYGFVSGSFGPSMSSAPTRSVVHSISAPAPCLAEVMGMFLIGTISFEEGSGGASGARTTSA